MKKKKKTKLFYIENTAENTDKFTDLESACLRNLHYF